jgi:hypothetical protein
MTWIKITVAQFTEYSEIATKKLKKKKEKKGAHIFFYT